VWKLLQGGTLDVAICMLGADHQACTHRDRPGLTGDKRRTVASLVLMAFVTVFRNALCFGWVFGGPWLTSTLVIFPMRDRIRQWSVATQQSPVARTVAVQRWRCCSALAVFTLDSISYLQIYLHAAIIRFTLVLLRQIKHHLLYATVQTRAGTDF